MMILKIIGWIIAAFFALLIISHLLGLVAIVSWLVACIVFVCGIIYLVSLTREDPAEKRAKGPHYKLWDPAGKVSIFKNEPSVQDLVKVKDDSSLKLVCDDKEVLSISNDSRVRILKESSESLKVKIISGPERGKTGWVCRSQVLKEDPPASGS